MALTDRTSGVPNLNLNYERLRLGTPDVRLVTLNYVFELATL